MNNPLGYNGSAKINAEKGIRSGRQKGAESILTGLPGLSGQIEYFGFDGIKIGLSGYYGKTNTTLYSEYVDDISEQANSVIDSSTVTMSMATLHTTFDRNQWTARIQYTIAGFENNESYNTFTGSDVPDLMHGMYALLAYDFIDGSDITLSPFVRFSHLNNNLSVPDNVSSNDALKQNILTLGINYKPHPGVVFKMDYQFYGKANGHNFNQFNTGVGVWF